MEAQNHDKKVLNYECDLELLFWMAPGRLRPQKLQFYEWKTQVFKESPFRFRVLPRSIFDTKKLPKIDEKSRQKSIRKRSWKKLAPRLILEAKMEAKWRQKSMKNRSENEVGNLKAKRAPESLN